MIREDMKICLASVLYLETTFPLAKHLADQGSDVSVFCIFPMESRNSNVIDYSQTDVKHGFDDRYTDVVFNQKLRKYLEIVKFRSFFYTNIKKEPFLNLFLAYRLSQYIKRQNFDVVHLVGSSPFLYLLHLFAGRRRIFHTLHEVTVHENNLTMSMHQKRLLDLICRRKISLIVPSEASMDRFFEYFARLDSKKYPFENRGYVIPFGLFETFNCFADDENIKEEENVILFFGRIYPYKGLNFLIDSVKQIVPVIPSVRLIIAGRGNLGYDNPLSESNFEVLNRFIPNEEIIRLIKRSKVVVCPYISASQSGIPMVAYLYNKPVIATNVGGFSEVIEHMKTGIIIPPADREALTRAIIKLITDKTLLDSMKKNIYSKYIHSVFSWKVIAGKTLEAYNNANT